MNMDHKPCIKLSNLNKEQLLLKNCYSSDDSIGQIPDEIVSDMILSRLSMKEAVSTSVISHRWKNLWKYYRGCLDFDDPKTKVILAYGSTKLFRVEQRNFVNWVDKVLASLQGVSIEQFRVSFDLGKHHTSTIDRWIEFAGARGVRRLELNLSSLLAEDNEWTPFKNLEEIYAFPTHSDGLKSLTSLRLEAVNITEAQLMSLLSECSLLEDFSLVDAPSLCKLRVVGGAAGCRQSLMLKHLEIRKCLGLEQLEVSAARKLASFKYEGHHQHQGQPMRNMLFKDVPQLTSASLERGDYCQHLVAIEFREFPFSAVQLRTLKLDLHDMISNKFHIFPREGFAVPFPNLCQLELAFLIMDEQSMLFVGSFLCTSPRLQKLVLKYKIDWYQTEMRKSNPDSWKRVMEFGERYQELVEGCKYECLKEAEFWGWNGHKGGDVDLFIHLNEAAAGSLERLTVNPCDPFRDPLSVLWREMTPSPDYITSLEDARDRARDLEPILSPASKLVVL